MAKEFNRREALKIMGTIGGAAMLGSFGVLSACNKAPKEAKKEAGDTNEKAAEKEPGAKPKRLVFFFTGTGNSLYVARELSADIISIPQALKKDRLSYEAEEIGIVYPIYGDMPPNMVRSFLKKAQLKCKYLFAVLTYGNRKCRAAEICAEIGREKGHLFTYISTIVMVDNWLPIFDMDEQKQIDKHIPENLARIKAAIESHQDGIEESCSEAAERKARLLAGASPTFTAEGIKARAEEWFTVTDNCITCGICSRVCPRNNYRYSELKAEPQGECELCLACAHACPHKAIIFTKGEKNPKARYRHPAVKLSDIQRANSQI